MPPTPSNSPPLHITVVTVVFNSVEVLEGTLLSVTGQSYPNMEYLVIDGGSTDGSLELIRKHKDGIKYWISEPDRGIYDAMNKSLKVATGDFLIFMNAGDTFFSDRTLEDFVQLSPDREKVYYGNANYIDSLNGKKFQRGGEFTKYRLSKTNICHQTIFYCKKAYQNHTYNLKYPVFADWAYNIQLYKSCDYTWLDQTIVQYDANGYSSTARDLNFEKAQKMLFLRYLGLDSWIYILFKKLFHGTV